MELIFNQIFTHSFKTHNTWFQGKFPGCWRNFPYLGPTSIYRSSFSFWVDFVQELKITYLINPSTKHREFSWEGKDRVTSQWVQPWPLESLSSSFQRQTLGWWNKCCLISINFLLAISLNFCNPKLCWHLSIHSTFSPQPVPVHSHQCSAVAKWQRSLWQGMSSGFSVRWEMLPASLQGTQTTQTMGQIKEML